MSDYGFRMVVSDLTSPQLKQIEAAIKSLGGTVEKQTRQMEESFGHLGNAANDLKKQLIELFAIREVFNFGKELLHLTAEFQGFENVIKYSSTGIVDTADNMEYLNGAISRLHLPMKEAYESFSEMQAGFYGTGIEGDKLRKVFEGVAEASSVLHLNPAKFSNVTFALKEIGELGTLQARQLRMLSFALPGAGNIAARSMGMTSEQLHEAMKKGTVKSADFLPKFSEALTAHFEAGLANAGHSLISQINDEKNSILTLMLDMGTTLEPLFLDILHTVSNGMKEIKSVWDALSGNPTFVTALKNIFDWAVKLIPIWIAYEIVVKASSLVTTLFADANNALAAALGTSTLAGEEATAAMASFNAVLDATLIGGIVATIGLLVEHLHSTNEELNAVIDKMGKFSTTNEFFNKQNHIASKITEQYNEAILLQERYDRQLADKKLSKEERKKITESSIGNKENLQNLANDIFKYQKIQKDSSGVISVRDSLAGAMASVQHPLTAWQRFHAGGIDYLRHNSEQAIIDSANNLHSRVAQNKDEVKSLKTIADTLVKKFGIKPKDTPGGPEGGNAGKENALNTSNLAGASGGLGSAKIIHMTIGVLQQNNGVHESKEQAAKAVQMITEYLNSFSDSQNSQ